MPTYKINYEQLRQQPQLGELLSALERGLEQFGIDFYLVGAVSRDVWMRGIHKIAPRRTTGDIDFAVLINDRGVYDSLKKYLINVEGFHPYKGNDFVLIWKDLTEVDLLPFAVLEDEVVTTSGLGSTNISLLGFKEVYEEGLPLLDLEGEHQFKFCTLQGIVLLKLIAWDDRSEMRRDDIKDISDILNHFFDMYDNEIWENHSDLFGNEDAELKDIAARVMGREMKKIATRNKNLFNRIEAILQANTEDIFTSKIGAIMTEYFNNDVEENVLLLQKIKQGFME